MQVPEFCSFPAPSSRVRGFSIVTTGHSRSKNGVTSLAYNPVVHAEVRL
jgi:hypothetical protein